MGNWLNKRHGKEEKVWYEALKHPNDRSGFELIIRTLLLCIWGSLILDLTMPKFLLRLAHLHSFRFLLF